MTAPDSTGPRPPGPTARVAPAGRLPDDGAPALGSSGPQVTELQWRLARLALYDGPYDGVFSAAVEDAVLRFQRTRGLDDPGGVHGAATREALRAETDGKGPDR
ncbi:peptidoglycan-binding domain-containing protein [Streptomyces sp. sk2.1]|uniref:peptidoglycan-binding domain-containing protein n=1 Tax=Streptomyces sp. sk2.1 TaxID=2478959 RepID=UPI0021CCDE61|nr:peptidoglycan-binding domain-containing protein [Streptomyces sp. sk2.1]